MSVLKKLMAALVVVVLIAATCLGVADTAALGGDLGVGIQCNCLGECEWVS